MNTAKNKTIAYLSMEIALENSLPGYAGGLGVLAGDILRSAADQGFPMVGVTLINKRGYLQQEIGRDGVQVARSEKKFNFSLLEKMKETVTVKMGIDRVVVQAWRYRVKGATGEVSVYLLDTDVAENTRENRRLTDRLYEADKTVRLKQEIILGRAGVRLLAALGYKIYKYHLNEGHGSLATVELLLSGKGRGAAKKLEQVRQSCVFTTHTPLPGAQDVFDKDFFLKYQNDWPEQLDFLFEKGKLNMTKLGLHCCGRVNAVSKLHQEVTKRMFPGYKIESVTNGVNTNFWTSPELAALYNQQIPGWSKDPSLLAKADDLLELAQLQAAHLAAKKRLLGYLHKKTGILFKDNVFTMVFARRFTPYKRPDYIFQDIKKLIALAKRHGGLQLIFAGKAHPSDLPGQKLIQKIYALSSKPSRFLKIVFLPDYDLEKARLLVSGADAWLSTPQPPLEASATSGMKAAHNGVPQISTNDGWWPEGYVKGRTGWMIRENRHGENNLYQLLDQEVLPFYYHNHRRWLSIMRSTISLNVPRFNTGRVLDEYKKKIYGWLQRSKKRTD